MTWYLSGGGGSRGVGACACAGCDGVGPFVCAGPWGVAGELMPVVATGLGFGAAKTFSLCACAGAAEELGSVGDGANTFVFLGASAAAAKRFILVGDVLGAAVFVAFGCANGEFAAACEVLVAGGSAFGVLVPFSCDGVVLPAAFAKRFGFDAASVGVRFVGQSGLGCCRAGCGGSGSGTGGISTFFAFNSASFRLSAASCSSARMRSSSCCRCSSTRRCSSSSRYCW